MSNLIIEISNLDIEILFELFYNLANEPPKKNNLTILTDYFTFYKIVTELMFLPRNDERTDSPMTNEYIEKIENLLPLADVELLDFVLQFLQQSIEAPVIPSSELQPA